MTEIDKNLYVESQGTWRHFDFHSKFADVEKDKLEAELKGAFINPEDFDVIIITYGTSWVYRLNGEVVANCHKVPAHAFKKELLSVNEIIQSFEKFYREDKKVILTLSPVRHIKDTMELNQVSKSILRTAIHEITMAWPEVDYFPAYEIMLDDLRDYRFYEPDMIHPSQTAIDYIWGKFGERYFSKETQDLNIQWLKLLRSINHRPFHPSTKQHQSFLRQTLHDLQELKDRIDVTREIEELESRLDA